MLDKKERLGELTNSLASRAGSMGAASDEQSEYEHDAAPTFIR